MRKKMVLILLLIISVTGYSQSPTKGALTTLDTAFKPNIKMLAIYSGDNLVYYWNLSYWGAVGGGSGSELWTESGSDIYRVSKVAVNKVNAGTDSTFEVSGTMNVSGKAVLNGIWVKQSLPATAFPGTSVGYNVGPAITHTGSQNHLFGTNSGQHITTGTQNTAFGYNTLYNDTAVVGTVAMGHNAMRGHYVGSYNVALGYEAMYNTTLTGSGSSNVGIGRNAMKNFTTASFNVGVGQSTGSATTTGNNNTFLGYLAGNTNTTGSGNVFIGANITGVTTRDNQLSIGGWIIGASGRIAINAPTDTTEQLTVGGNIKLATAGNKLMIATGSNASMGTATLSSGSVTINTTAVTANSIIIACYGSQGAGVVAMLQPGHIYVDSQTAGTSFVIRSTNNSDGSKVSWWIIN